MADDLQPGAKLTITQRADGSVYVEGPIKNLLLCYGMLECAKDAVRDFCKKCNAEQAERDAKSDIFIPKMIHDA